LASNTEKGRFGEGIAEQFLKQKGYEILDRNYRFDRAEIDLIARQKSEIVFVEVKYREKKGFGDPLEAVTNSKIAHLFRAAEHWIDYHELSQVSARFDVLGILRDRGRISVEHVENAFVLSDKIQNQDRD
jgi:putative endonuclease